LDHPSDIDNEDQQVAGGIVEKEEILRYSKNTGKGRIEKEQKKHQEKN
jgi:hypothetical protein